MSAAAEEVARSEGLRPPSGILNTELQKPERGPVSAQLSLNAERGDERIACIAGTSVAPSARISTTAATAASESGSDGPTP
jgi:hypothetical protein